jgi:hypothetical protein
MKNNKINPKRFHKNDEPDYRKMVLKLLALDDDATPEEIQEAFDETMFQAELELEAEDELYPDDDEMKILEVDTNWQIDLLYERIDRLENELLNIRAEKAAEAIVRAVYEGLITKSDIDEIVARLMRCYDDTREMN